MQLNVARGLDEARAALSRRRTWTGDDGDAPASARERNRAVFGEPLTPAEAVRRILADVRTQGDAAVRRYAKLLDGHEAKALEVPRSEWEAALKAIPADLVDALRVAAARVREFHQASMPRGWMDHERGLGEMIVPLERVGVYAPGGTAVYPSTVLMTAIPARVAGVREIILASPTRGAAPHPAILAAAHIAGVDRVFQVGGVHAMAALAYGTASVPKVDKICGPGGLYVTLAKRALYGTVDIDGLYGPTETVLIADDSADPVLAAADLLAQAEHDDLASPIMVTTSASFVAAVAAEIERQMPGLERRAICEASLKSGGLMAVVETLDEAVEIANLVAPEHLCLLVRDPWSLVGRVRNAGGIFVGERSPEVVGDFVAGPSHVMPTGGTARFSSCLGVRHFLKTVPVIALPARDYPRLARAGAAIARAEGLTAHARAFEVRFETGHVKDEAPDGGEDGRKRTG